MAFLAAAPWLRLWKPQGPRPGQKDARRELG